MCEAKRKFFILLRRLLKSIAVLMRKCMAVLMTGRMVVKPCQTRQLIFHLIYVFLKSTASLNPHNAYTRHCSYLPVLTSQLVGRNLHWP